MYHKLLKLYNSFDTRSKRCLIIDLYSILFIILPSKFFLSKMKGTIWGVLLFYLLCVVKGKKEVFIKDNNFIYSINKKKKLTIV